VKGGHSDLTRDAEYEAGEPPLLASAGCGRDDGVGVGRATASDGRTTCTQTARADLKSSTATVKLDGLAVQHLSDAHRAKHSVGLAAVKQNGLALAYLSEPLQASRKIGLAAVKQNGLAYVHLSVELQADKDVGLAAVTQNGLCLQYLHAALVADVDIGIAAFMQNREAFLLLHDDFFVAFDAVAFVCADHTVAEAKSFIALQRRRNAWVRSNHVAMGFPPMEEQEPDSDSDG
jgi:hypothetical protein